MAIERYYRTLSLMVKSELPKDTRGGVGSSWIVAQPFLGLISQVNAQEADANSRLNVVADYKLYCPVDTPITRANRVKDGSKTYRVASDPHNAVDRDHHYKIFLKRTDDEDVS